MTEHELELRLRDYYRLEVADDGAPSFLRSTVTAIPETVPASPFQGRRGLVLLIAAALLAALLAGGAIAIGTGLIDLSRTMDVVLPTPSESAAPGVVATKGFTTAGSIGGCENPAMPDGVAAFLWTSAPVAGQGTGLKMTWVLDDGRVLIAPANAAPDQAWSQRPLTRNGVVQLLDSLIQSDLPNCGSYALGTSTPDQFNLSVRAAAGTYTISLGGGGAFIERPTTPAQAAVVQDLLARLQDPDLGLEAGAWTDAAWTPYVSDTWQLQVDDMGGGPGGPLTDQVTLPDGTPLLQVGAVDPTAAERGVVSARCAMVDRETASYVLDQLRGAGNPPGTWDFSNVTVTVQPTLAGARCPSAAEATPPPTPAPAPVPPSGSDICGFLSSEDVQRAFDAPDAAADVRPDTSFEGWAACWYSGGKMMAPDPAQGAVLVRLQAVAADQAQEQAASLFGSSMATIQIAGHDVYYNGCEPLADRPGCQPSVAISLEPDFIVLLWDQGSQEELVALATALLDHVDNGGS